MTNTHGNESSNGLAIMGGRPSFPEKIFVGRPNLGDKGKVLERIEAVLDSGWLTNNGRYVREFERRVAAITGAAHCVAVCNATTGLQIAARALQLQGEVILPSFTFAATAHALQWQGITPVFCDVDPITHAIDPREVERLITPRTTGIIGVHLWGHACDTEALEKIARDHRLKLLFDAAHAFGCSHAGRMIGTFGNAEVFSFHATKFCNSLEGGAITTDSAALAQKLRELRNFGLTQEDQINEVGTNGKMSEVSAAMGVTSLESMADFIALNRRNYFTYRNALRGIPGVRLFEYSEADRNNYQYIIIEVDRKTAALNRDELQQALQAENIMAKRYFYPGCHQMAPYRYNRQTQHRRLPVTEQLAEETLALPTGAAVCEKTVKTICEAISMAVQQAARIRQALSRAKENGEPGAGESWKDGLALGLWGAARAAIAAGVI